MLKYGIELAIEFRWQGKQICQEIFLHAQFWERLAWRWRTAQDRLRRRGLLTPLAPAHRNREPQPGTKTSPRRAHFERGNRSTPDALCLSPTECRRAGESASQSVCVSFMLAVHWHHSACPRKCPVQKADEKLDSEWLESVILGRIMPVFTPNCRPRVLPRFTIPTRRRPGTCRKSFTLLPRTRWMNSPKMWRPLDCHANEYTCRDCSRITSARQAPVD